jgi:integrase
LQLTIATLADYLEQSFLPDRIALSAGYVAEMRRVVRQFGNPELSQLSKPLLAEFLRGLSGSAATTNNKRREILTLWRAAHDDGVAPSPAAPRRVPEPSDPPTAWTVEEVGELLWTARHWPGEYNGVPAGIWWESLFSVTYWTAARIGALLKTPWENFSGDRLLVAGRTQKNLHGQSHRLPAHCLDRLATLPHIGKLIWPWPCCRRWFFNRARRIIERAGLDAPKLGRNLFHKLRRTNISYCAVVDLGIAQRQAGHASSRTTIAHYIAPAITHQATAADVLPVPAF